VVFHHAVTGVYLADPDTLPIHRCEKCGYPIPTHIGSGAEKCAAYFSKCPLSAGRSAGN